MQRTELIVLIETMQRAGGVFLIFTVVTEVVWPGFVTRSIPIWWPLGVEILLTLVLARMRRP